MSDSSPSSAGLAEVWTAWLRALDEAGFPATANVRPPASAEEVRAAEAVFGAPFPADLAALYLHGDVAGGRHRRSPTVS